MCGVGAVISKCTCCTSTALSRDEEVNGIAEMISNRGPDGMDQVTISDTITTSKVTLVASVLHLRGTEPTLQPITDVGYPIAPSIFH